MMDFEAMILILLAVFIVIGLIKKIFKLVIFGLILVGLYLLYMYAVDQGLLTAMMALWIF